MIPSALFARYSRALADVALEAGVDADVSRDLHIYREIFRAAPEAMAALHSPGIAKQAKEGLLAALMERYPVSGITSNFLRILLDHHRLGYFHEICDHYARILDERKGVVAATVTIAGRLTERQTAELREKISGVTGREVKMELHSDPGLIGGLVLRIGSTVYDGSVRRQLSEIKTRLSAG
ncbi:MAG: ATP synthase F1 subunit delta [Acidobacteria bacterium]|nr:ATP synthase F1 subunit delta [Acidobacteriota bacterium]